MALTPISLGTRSNPNRNDTQSKLINCYAENLGDDNEAQWALYACDGFQSFATLPSPGGVAVGMLNFDDAKLYVVTGARVNKVDTAGTATSLGAIVTTGYVYMARNRKTPNAQIAVVASDGAFLLIENDVVTQPSVSPDIGTFNSVCGMDGYFIFTKSDGEWYISSIDEGGTIDVLEFAQANKNPDGAVRGITRGSDVLICGPRSIEAYQNTGQADFPFERVTTIAMGVAYAPAMVQLAAVVDGTMQDVVIFPGNNSDGSFAGVMMLSGYQPVKISSPDVDRCIRDEPSKSSIRAFTRVDNGHVIYTITASTFTREYNCDTQRWHDRKSTGTDKWRIVDACQFNGSTILADYLTGTLYRQSHTLTPGSASTIAMRHSNNGGSTWSPSRSRTVSSSKTRRVRFPQLGQSREDGKVFELTFSNAIVEAGTGTDAVAITPPVHAFPKPMEFHNLYVNVTSGTSQTNSAKGFVNLAVDVVTVEA